MISKHLMAAARQVNQTELGLCSGLPYRGYVRNSKPIYTAWGSLIPLLSSGLGAATST
jgi:hypothetical protein